MYAWHFSPHPLHLLPPWSEPPFHAHLCYWNSFTFLIFIIVPSNLFWKKARWATHLRCETDNGTSLLLVPHGLQISQEKSGITRPARPHLLGRRGLPLPLSHPTSCSPTHSSATVQLVSDSADRTPPSMLCSKAFAFANSSVWNSFPKMPTWLSS